MGVTSIISRSMVNEGIGDSTSLSVARTVGVVESAMTLNVPSDFTTLQDAMDWIEARILLAEVTIQIADGTYNVGTEHILNHPNYVLVSIIGNETTPANVTFNCSGADNGFRIEGCLLRALKGIKITNSTYHGIITSYLGGIRELRKVTIDSVGFGLSSHYGSIIKGYDITVNNCGTYYGFWAYSQSHMDITNLTSTNNNLGVYAQFAGSIYLRGSSTLSGNNTNYNPTLNASETTDGSIIWGP